MPKVRIASYAAEAFEDRREAGRLLAQELQYLKGLHAVALGIPRGGIVVGDELAAGIGAELDIVLSRKLRTPGHQELAMGSVSEDGHVFLNERVVNEIGLTAEEIEREKAYQMVEIGRRSALVRRVRPKVPLRDRIAVVTDDGVATGATFEAALWAARQEHPLKLIAAIPVGSEDTVSRLAEFADETLCLRAPSFFWAVGQFYARFDPVEDDEVLNVLAEALRRQHGRRPEVRNVEK